MVKLSYMIIIIYDNFHGAFKGMCFDLDEVG